MIPPSEDVDPQGSGSLLVRAMRGEEVERTPVWFMRQAGRSLPEYRALRRSGGLLELCHDPALAAEVTMQPVRRHGVDAAILFSDIVFPLHAIGVGVEIRPGVGPVLDEPVRTRADLERLRPFEPDVDAPEVGETVRLVREGLSVPVIGFAGAPFTVASYLVEGGPSKVQARTRALMLSDPELWAALCERLADHAVSSLEAQVRAGAAAVQLFDSLGRLALGRALRGAGPARHALDHRAPAAARCARRLVRARRRAPARAARRRRPRRRRLRLAHPALAGARPPR